MAFLCAFCRLLLPYALVVAVVTLGFTVSAETGNTEARLPRLEAEIDIEIQNDWTFDSDDRDAERNDLFTKTEPALALHILPGLSVESGLVLEPVEDPESGEDRIFEDHGFFAEQLYLLYQRNGFSLYGGKFNLSFGVAFDLAPGIYGNEVAEDFYEQVERIGIGGTMYFGGGRIADSRLGMHRLSVQTFFLDTTVLSESFGTGRGRTRKSDGGVSNTEDFSSFALSLDGGDFPELPFALNYRLGVAYQAGGEGDPKDELGLAAALYGTVDLARGARLAPIVEFVHFDNAEGADQDRDILTAGAALYHGPWNVALSYSGVRTDPDDGGTDLDLDQIQVSMGYSFDFGLDVDIGYNFVEQEGVESHVVGILMHYVLDFTIAD